MKRDKTHGLSKFTLKNTLLYSQKAADITFFFPFHPKDMLYGCFYSSLCRLWRCVVGFRFPGFHRVTHTGTKSEISFSHYSVFVQEMRSSPVTNRALFIEVDEHLCQRPGWWKVHYYCLFFSLDWLGKGTCSQPSPRAAAIRLVCCGWRHPCVELGRNIYLCFDLDLSIL